MLKANQALWKGVFTRFQMRIRKYNKNRTDVAINGYKGEVITFQTCSNIFKFTKNAVKSENLP